MKKFFFFFNRHYNPLLRFGLLNYPLSLLSRKVFYWVLLPAARQTPNLEDQWLERPNSRHKTPPASETTQANPSSGRWNYEREMAENFAESGDFHVTFGFFYMPRFYGMGPAALLPLRRKAHWGFFCPKNPTASAGFESANLGTKVQHATSRPPKPLNGMYTYRKHSYCPL